MTSLVLGIYVIKFLCACMCIWQTYSVFNMLPEEEEKLGELYKDYSWITGFVLYFFSMCLPLFFITGPYMYLAYMSTWMSVKIFVKFLCLFGMVQWTLAIEASPLDRTFKVLRESFAKKGIEKTDEELIPYAKKAKVVAWAFLVVPLILLFIFL